MKFGTKALDDRVFLAGDFNAVEDVHTYSKTVQYNYKHNYVVAIAAGGYIVTTISQTTTK